MKRGHKPADKNKKHTGDNKPGNEGEGKSKGSGFTKPGPRTPVRRPAGNTSSGGNSSGTNPWANSSPKK